MLVVTVVVAIQHKWQRNSIEIVFNPQNRNTRQECTHAQLIMTNTDKEQNRTKQGVFIHRGNKGTIRQQVNVTIN